MDTKKMLELTERLVAKYERQPGLTAETLTHSDDYLRFVGEAWDAGFTGPDMELDEHFSERSASWIASARLEELQRWVYTLLRVERANYEWPCTIFEALEGGHLQALAERLLASRS